MAEQTRQEGAVGTRRAVLALCVVALVLGGAGAALPHDVFWHSDEGAKFLQMVNLRLGPQGLDSAITYPGRGIDPTLRFAPFHPKQHRVDAAGNLYLQWPIFLPLLTWPFYALLGLGGLGVLPLSGALLACWLSYRLALAVGTPARRAWPAIPALGLGTPLGFYSWVFFEHTLAAALVAGAVLLGLRAGAGGQRRSLVAAGLVLGAAIYLRSELYVLVPAAGSLFAARLIVHRRAGRRHHAGRLLRGGAAALAGLLLALLPLWGFYLFSEGTPLPQHATWYFDTPSPEAADPAAAGGPHLPELRYLAQAGAGIIPDFLAGPVTPAGAPIRPWVAGALLVSTLVVLVAALLPWLAVLRAKRPALPSPTPARNTQHATRTVLLLAGLALLAVGAGAVLLDTQPYTSLHGFVLAAPVVVCAALAARPGGRTAAPRTRLAALTGLYILLHVLIISALSGLGPISRYEWGQRYLLPAYPLLIALTIAALGRMEQDTPTSSTIHNPKLVLSAASGSKACPERSERIQNRPAVVLAVLLALIGAGFLARGWSVLATGKADARAWQAAVAAAPDAVVVTDHWWLPLVLAPQFYAHTWLLAPDATTAAAWPVQAAREGLAGFSTATFGATLAGPFATATPPVHPGPATTRAGLTVQHFDLPR